MQYQEHPPLIMSEASLRKCWTVWTLWRWFWWLPPVCWHLSYCCLLYTSCDQYREFWLLLPYCRLFGEGSGGSDRFLRCCAVPEGKKTRRQAVIMYGHRTACSSENHRRQCRWYCEDLKSTGVQWHVPVHGHCPARCIAASEPALPVRRLVYSCRFHDWTSEQKNYRGRELSLIHI